MEEISIPTDTKLQHRSLRSMEKQGRMTPPKVHNSSTTELKDIEMTEILKYSKVFKSF
jgi:hypothetical protein